MSARIERCLVVGCNGRFGRVFAHKLGEAGIAVSGLDRQPDAVAPERVRPYRQAGLPRPDARALELVAEADCVLLCLPEPAVVEALPLLLRSASSGALLVDVASVKSRVAATLRAHEAESRDVDYLSLHPMFAPRDDFRQRNLCVVPLGPGGPRARHLRELLGAWGARLTELSAEEHDRVVAFGQAGAHVLLLAFGLAVARSPVPPETLLRLATPVQEALLGMVARVVATEDPDLYAGIQRDNPFAQEARDALGKILSDLAHAVGREPPGEAGEGGMARRFDEIAHALGPEVERLSALAAEIVELARSGSAD
jgi:prephenate dehydrogenase